MKIGDRVYGKPGVFFPTFAAAGMVVKITTHGYFGGSGDNIELAEVRLDNNETHTVPLSSLQTEGQFQSDLFFDSPEEE